MKTANKRVVVFSGVIVRELVETLTEEGKIEVAKERQSGKWDNWYALLDLFVEIDKKYRSYPDLANTARYLNFCIDRMNARIGQDVAIDHYPCLLWFNRFRGCNREALWRDGDVFDKLKQVDFSKIEAEIRQAKIMNPLCFIKVNKIFRDLYWRS